MDKWMNERKGLNGWTKVTHGKEKGKELAHIRKINIIPNIQDLN